MNLNHASFFVSAFLLSLGIGGCAAADATSASDDGSEEAVDASEDELSATANFGYFKVTRRDYRRCVAPLCGGFFVKRVNEAKTLCADGTRQAECYVSSIELKNLVLSQREEEEFRGALESGKALVKARTYRTKWNGLTLGTLKASEAWVGATGKVVTDGTYFRAASNGIVCIKAPCPSTTATQLNSSRIAYSVVNVNLPTSADAQLRDRAMMDLSTREGILVVGGVALPKCLPTADCGPWLGATEFYLRVTRREGQGCGSRGLAWCNAGQYCAWKPDEICGAFDAGGVCTYKPEVCNKIYAPVCACDGKTYGNECEAAANGASVSSPGACQP